MTAPTRPGSLFRQRSFALLWSSQSISLLGTQITYVALPITAVVVLHATALQAGILASLEQLPFLLFGLVVGVIVDRRARRPVLITANVVRFVAVAAIPVAYLVGALTMGELFAVVFVVGTMTVFFEVAYPSYVPGLVGRDRLMEANGKLQVSESVAEVAGPGVAGALISVLSAPVVIIVDAVSYLLSAVALVRMPRDERPAGNTDGGRDTQSVLASIREGFGVIARHPALRWCTTAAVTMGFFFSAVMAVFFLFLIRDAGIPAAEVGVVVAVGSAGALCGALAADRLTGRFGVGATLIASLLLPGVGYLMLAAVQGHSVGAVVMAATASFVGLFGIPVFDVTVISFRQVVTPDHLLGRVNATVRTLAWGSLSVGALAGGALGSAVGLRPTIVMAAAGLLLPAVIVLISPVRSVRSLDDTVPADADATPSTVLRHEQGGTA